jgi:hypothetical protein
MIFWSIIIIAGAIAVAVALALDASAAHRRFGGRGD